MTTILEGLDGLKAAVGTHLGYSDWFEITQERVNQFADATGDHQWIHIDPERAKAGPFGGPIAHGYLTLSLVPMLMPQVYVTKGAKMGVNYGLNKLRFTNPVPVGSNVRMGLAIAAVDEFPGGATTTFDITIEIEGKDKPAIVAQGLFRTYF